VFEEAYLPLTSRVDEGATEEGYAGFICIKNVPLKVTNERKFNREEL
jgi:hypothetical protein